MSVLVWPSCDFCKIDSGINKKFNLSHMILIKSLSTFFSCKKLVNILIPKINKNGINHCLINFQIREHFSGKFRRTWVKRDFLYTVQIICLPGWHLWSRFFFSNLFNAFRWWASNIKIQTITKLQKPNI